MKKNWIVAFGTEKFYLTDEEMSFYRQQLLDGKKFIALKSGMVLSDKALYIASTEQFREADMLEEGKWQCVAGIWHPNSQKNCICQYKYEVVDGVAIRTKLGELMDGS